MKVFAVAFTAPNKQPTSPLHKSRSLSVHLQPHSKLNSSMAGQGMVDPAIFEDLQARVDEDTAVRDVRAPIDLRKTFH
jgi:hypothetical protein